ncbi:MAG TPA: hypothetical protein VGO40_08595 [Longimicrobium sp.]|nr:hypothetical protein [Longimicrobium sp.]
MSRRVRVTIDELALGGFPPAERAAIVAGLRRELAARLAAPGALPAEGRAIPRLGAGTLAPAASPQATGARVAEAVVKGISR